jgi:chemotaxis protein MotB
MGQSKAIRCRALFFLLVAGILSALVPPSAFSAQSLAAIEKQNLDMKVRQYRERVEEIERDNLERKMDEEWVMLKILHIQDQDRQVPSELKKSLEVTRKKMGVARREISRLREYIAAHEKRLRALSAAQEKETPVAAPLPGPVEGVKPPGIVPAPLPTPAALPAPRGGASARVEEIARRIRTADLSDWVELIEGEEGLRLETRLPILFASGKTAIAKEYRRFFKQLAGLLKPFPVRVKVEGFTDRSRGKKKASSNLELGARRAASVVGELVKNGMDPGVFEIASRGAYGVSSAVDSRRSKALSRRAEVTVYFK